MLCNNYYLNVYVSFDALSNIDLKDFEWLEELRCHEERNYLVGTISYLKLLRSRWIHQPCISIIICPDGVMENMEAAAIKKRSLELAGVKLNDSVRDAVNVLSV